MGVLVGEHSRQASNTKKIGFHLLPRHMADYQFWSREQLEPGPCRTLFGAVQSICAESQMLRCEGTSVHAPGTFLNVPNQLHQRLPRFS